MKGRDAGDGAGARGEAGGDDDSGAHCGVRRIQGSKSDYQLVSEARLRCSLAFRRNFLLCDGETMTPLHGPTQPQRGARATPPSATPPHPETTQQQNDSTAVH